MWTKRMIDGGKRDNSRANQSRKRIGSFRLFRKAGILVFWLLLWQAAALFIHNSILLAGPEEVLEALAAQLKTAVFWKTLVFSSGRICLGFLAAFFSGILLGSLACRRPFFRELTSPVLLLFKSIPVASFVILALIWMGSENLSVFIAFTVVLPMIESSTFSGLKSADPKLLEMAAVFRIPFSGRVRGIYLPALIPYLRSSVRAALGLAVKSGVAAEVIGVPDFSIGGQLYMAKIYLSTADLFAWTAVVILITYLFEKLFLLLLDRADPASRPGSEGEH